MSYCRWSSDNWKSDVYAYESDAGFVVHVAANRIVGEVPPLPELTRATAAEYATASKAAHAYLDACEHRPIGLPFDGMTFNEADAEGLRDRLLALREAGYSVPQFAIDALEDEMAEEASV